MRFHAQRGGLWLFGQARQLGLLSRPVCQSMLKRAYFVYKRHCEDPFHQLTRRHPQLFEGGDVLDVGANIGYTAVVFARAVDPGCRVWAFEPSSENFAWLQSTIASAHLAAAVVPVRTAIGDRIDHVELTLNEFHFGDHRVRRRGSPSANGRRCERVPLTTLDAAVDQWRIDRVSFIKIDVQGYELRVCHGMMAVLDANPQASVAVEYAADALADAGERPGALLAFFADRRYAAYRLERRGGLVRVDAGTIEAELTSGYVDLLFTRHEL